LWSYYNRLLASKVDFRFLAWAVKDVYWWVLVWGCAGCWQGPSWLTNWCMHGCVFRVKIATFQFKNTVSVWLQFSNLISRFEPLLWQVYHWYCLLQELTRICAPKLKREFVKSCHTYGWQANSKSWMPISLRHHLRQVAREIAIKLLLKFDLQNSIYTKSLLIHPLFTGMGIGTDLLQYRNLGFHVCWNISD